MNDLSGKVAIVGVDESDAIGVVPDKSAMQLHAVRGRQVAAGYRHGGVVQVLLNGRIHSLWHNKRQSYGKVCRGTRLNTRRFRALMRPCCVLFSRRSCSAPQFR